ncbi:MAG: hypothetical protein AUK47_11910 [Deltaproteobacteria bacterium CG2_30_63_29]|nr:MAG: hypothetical protein AUK47_11910 [Deltaproteobacteria bacterium CG2_30_63_29]PJB44602.1 MAG: hypothetical protein CO108_08485 [Deltaproteobacteria bacterium CG_4_9_14_3_um_filter_63_12]
MTKASEDLVMVSEGKLRSGSLKTLNLDGELKDSANIRIERFDDGLCTPSENLRALATFSDVGDECAVPLGDHKERIKIGCFFAQFKAAKADSCFEVNKRDPSKHITKRVLRRPYHREHDCQFLAPSKVHARDP